ncbi:hypothetical protein AX16_006918 [Volvariella volvacea WC 439]|nr:hypothetical protein AX16_006918 [Volvariella volvacea WC 439]
MIPPDQPAALAPAAEGPPSGKRSKISPGVLPHPTYTQPDPSKKSHARKQPAGHVPRPRNAFILFRCDFVRQGKVPADVESDHRNISRIAGRIWREMSDKDKRPWMVMAKVEKDRHRKKYPEYRYLSPNALSGPTSKAKLKKESMKAKATTSSTSTPEFSETNDSVFRVGHDPLDCEWDEISSLLASDTAYAVAPEPLRRASSCPPPGAIPVAPPAEYQGLTILETKDDLSRRPSRTITYHSLPLDNAPSISEGLPRRSFTFPWARGLNLGPPMSLGAYTVGPSFDNTPWAADSDNSLGLWGNIVDPKELQQTGIHEMAPTGATSNPDAMKMRESRNLIEFINPFAPIPNSIFEPEDDAHKAFCPSLHEFSVTISPTSTCRPPLPTTSWPECICSHDSKSGITPLLEPDEQFMRDLQEHFAGGPNSPLVTPSTKRRTTDEIISISSRTLPLADN